MARSVEINCCDELVKITTEGGKFHVHKHLLCDRSELLRVEIEDRVPVNTLDCGNITANWPAFSRYFNFLYGQPMWTLEYEADPPDSWDDLAEVHDICMAFDDIDATDICRDAMRELLENFSDQLDDPWVSLTLEQKGHDDFCCRLLVDYMVHKRCMFKEWYEAYQDQDKGEDLDGALSEEFAKEARRKKAGGDPPNLMDRGRYHIHTDKGRTCYLDKPQYKLSGPQRTSME